MNISGEQIDDAPMITEPRVYRSTISAKRLGGYYIAKRCFDIVLSFICLIVLSPVSLIIAILVHQEDSGPIIHRRHCVSATGTFDMLNLRCMEDIDRMNEIVGYIGT